MTRLAVVFAVLLLPIGGGPLAEEPAAEPVESAAKRMGLDIENDAPMTIDAEELEAVRLDDGRDRVTFRRSVAVVQGDLQIDCDELTAVYQAGGAGGGPERIDAQGNVRIRQPGVELICETAAFDRVAQRARCKAGGEPAVLTRGEDVVRGREIEFDLQNGIFTVKGGARVEHMKANPE